MKCELDRLGDYIDILSGYAFKSKDFLDKGVPVIKIKNVTPPNVSLNDLSYVSLELAKKAEKYVLEYDDVLIAMTGSHINQWTSVVGRVARVKYSGISLLNQRVGKILIKDFSKVDIDYIYYLLSQNSIIKELASKAGGAANQANINPSDIKELSVPRRDLQIQKKIGSILRKYDDLIENNQKQIKLLEEAVQRLYKEWFVDLRFPGHDNVKIVDGVPEGWSKTVLGALAPFRRGTTITKSKLIKGKVPVIAGGLEPAYFHNKANTVAPVITVSASGANAGHTLYHNRNVFASDCSFIDASITEKTCYIYCFLKHYNQTIRNLQKGSAQPHVYAKDLNELSIFMPDKWILDKFVEYANCIFDKIESLRKCVESLQEARDRLLPKLMSGEIEV